jgi:DNA modification methylase
VAIEKQVSGNSWTMALGDCVEGMRDLPDDSIDFCVHSPPFANLYIYSDSERDMGNCATDEEFFQHYRFAIDELCVSQFPVDCVRFTAKIFRSTPTFGEPRD